MNHCGAPCIDSRRLIAREDIWSVQPPDAPERAESTARTLLVDCLSGGIILLNFQQQGCFMWLEFSGSCVERRFAENIAKTEE